MCILTILLYRYTKSNPPKKEGAVADAGGVKGVTGGSGVKGCDRDRCLRLPVDSGWQQRQTLSLVVSPRREKFNSRNVVWLVPLLWPRANDCSQPLIFSNTSASIIKLFSLNFLWYFQMDDPETLVYKRHYALWRKKRRINRLIGLKPTNRFV